MYLIFDTETTGIPSKTFRPRIVQLAALFVDTDGNILETINTLIKPDGWTIPQELVEKFGRSTEMCEASGRPMPEILAEFNAIKAKSKMRVAHNLRFDKQLMAIEAEIYGIHHDSSEILSFCTSQGATDHCKIPPTEKMLQAGFNKFKQPSLQEAYTHFFGVPFEGAHDALADVIACKEVFFKLRGLQKEAA